jgi:excisionase family DNA binding protein
MNPLWNADQVAEKLGVSRRTVDAMVADGEAPPYTYVRRQRRWRPEAVDAWVQSSSTTSPRGNTKDLPKIEEIA